MIGGRRSTSSGAHVRPDCRRAPDREAASEVARTLARLQTARVVELRDIVAVIKDQDGKVKLEQTVDVVDQGALGGKFSDYDIDDPLMQELGAAATARRIGAGSLEATCSRR